MSTLLQDIRYGLRGMRRSPVTTAAAVFSLALGIGANTAIFSFVNALILRMLPVENPGALVFFGPANSSGNSDGFPDGNMSLFSYSIYREMAQKNQVFSGVAAVNSFNINMYGIVDNSSNAESLNIQLVSGTYFNVLGVKPVAGRLFTEADDQVPGGHPLAVISYKWWTSRFSGDRAAIGKTLKIRTTIYTIIGIAPRGFLGTTLGESQDMWIPLQMTDEIERGPHKINDKLYRSLDIFARLKPGVSPASANANVNVVLKGILQDWAGAQPSQEHLLDIQKASIELEPAGTGKSLLRRQFDKPLWMLMALVGLVLLIACANIANLLLARGATRQREIAVRVALGAGRVRLIRQLLTESLMLAGIGGALGILFASWASGALFKMATRGPGTVNLDVSLDYRVLGFAFLVCLATVFLFGIVPAMRTADIAPAESFSGGRSGAAGERSSVLGKALIVAQVSLSLVLLISAGLFVRSLIKLTSVDTGFQRQNVLWFSVDSRATGFTNETQLANFYRRVEERTSAIPDVQAVSFSVFAFNQGGWNEQAWAEGDSAAPPAERIAWYNAVGPGYFDTMGSPILDGRPIGAQDTATSPRVAVINETMARRFFPGGSPVGKRFGMGDAAHSKDIEVVGVVRDSRYFQLDEGPRAVAYFPYTQYIPDWGIGLYLSNFQVRFAGNPAGIVQSVRDAIAGVNANAPIRSVQTLAERVDDSVASQRLVAELSGFFGILAVFLACIGIYGLMSFAVVRRTHEIGIRMALGAGQREVLRMVLREVVMLVGIGLAAGIPVAIAGERWIESLLFGMSALDPATLVGATIVLLGAAALAGYLPARRAAKLDPIVALRHE
jgi:predicted permease